jgi:tryptophan synthase alpha chain
MPFIVGGHPPSARATVPTADLLLALERAGASVVEVGYPFSDPIADGPVIAAAMHEALQRGVTPATVNAQIRSARDAGLTIGVVAMVSVSIVHRVGVATFAQDAKAAGVDGLIVPDAPFDEAALLSGPLADAGLTLSMLIAPTTPQDRAARIAAASSGFVYILARAGITGTGGGVDSEPIARRVRELRNATSLPLAVGFGVSTPQHVRAVVHDAGADAAIVGSALVKRLSADPNPVHTAELFTRELAAGLEHPQR